MAQHTKVVFKLTSYSRADYTALRAHCLKIPLATITRLYYSDDSPQVEQGLERFLIAMRADLIERAIVHNPAFADILAGARQGGALTTKALAILIEAADVPALLPSPVHLISLWFRPKSAGALRSEGITTLAHLVDHINARGAGWWRSIPRIGKLRARVIVKWLRAYAYSVGDLLLTDMQEDDRPKGFGVSKLLLSLDRPTQLAPIGHFVTPQLLDGSAGINRSLQFSYIQANNDLEAIEFYLSRFDTQIHTFRSYRKELERFLLWSIMVMNKPMSSLLVDDCELYKRFLIDPSPAFIGTKCPRLSLQWKPFTAKTLSARSQKHAIGVIRGAFDYLVQVRYLGGNPWSAVKDPSVTQQVDLMQIEKALPEELWEALVRTLSEECADPHNAQARTVLAAILLMGDSGLRRNEVATALRCNLKSSVWDARVSELRVLGKRNKLREVPVSARTVAALKAHWEDRCIPFNDIEISAEFLLCPLVIPAHASARKKHLSGTPRGYSSDGLYQLVRTSLKKLGHQTGQEEAFTAEQRHHLLSTTPHAFRHTFGTLAVADGMPIDVAQAVLGHESPGTTGIYVKAKKKRMMEEAAKYFHR